MLHDVYSDGERTQRRSNEGRGTAVAQPAGMAAVSRDLDNASGRRKHLGSVPLIEKLRACHNVRSISPLTASVKDIFKGNAHSLVVYREIRELKRP